MYPLITQPVSVIVSRAQLEEYLNYTLSIAYQKIWATSESSLVSTGRLNQTTSSFTASGRTLLYANLITEPHDSFAIIDRSRPKFFNGRQNSVHSLIKRF